MLHKLGHTIKQGWRLFFCTVTQLIYVYSYTYILFDGTKFFGLAKDDYVLVRGIFETSVLESFEKDNSLGY